MGDKDVENSGNGSLIPGLSNDLAMLCLARVPYHVRRACTRVSSLWRAAIAGAELQHIQSLEGLEEEILCVCLGVQEVQEQRALVFEGYSVAHREWFKLPPLPLACLSSWKPHRRHDHFAGYEVVAVGRKLLLMGGAFYRRGEPNALRAPQMSADVWAFDATRGGGGGAWCQLAPMSHARTFFAAAALDAARVLVAGSNFAATAEVLDVRTGAWRAAEDMPYPGDTCRGVAKDGRYYAVWHRHPFHGPRPAHVYDAGSNTWRTLAGFFPSNGSLATSQPMAVLGGELYATQGERESRMNAVSVLRRRPPAPPFPFSRPRPSSLPIAGEGDEGRQGRQGAGAAEHEEGGESKLGAAEEHEEGEGEAGEGGAEVWEAVARLPRRMRERRGREEASVQGHFVAAASGKLVLIQSVAWKHVAQEEEEEGLYDAAEVDDDASPPCRSYMSILRPCYDSRGCGSDSGSNSGSNSGSGSGNGSGSGREGAARRGRRAGGSWGWRATSFQWETFDEEIGAGVSACGVIRL